MAQVCGDLSRHRVGRAPQVEGRDGRRRWGCVDCRRSGGAPDWVVRNRCEAWRRWQSLVLRGRGYGSWRRRHCSEGIGGLGRGNRHATLGNDRRGRRRRFAGVRIKAGFVRHLRRRGRGRDGLRRMDLKARGLVRTCRSPAGSIFDHRWHRQAERGVGCDGHAIRPRERDCDRARRRMCGCFELGLSCAIRCVRGR